MAHPTNHAASTPPLFVPPRSFALIDPPVFSCSFLCDVRTLQPTYVGGSCSYSRWGRIFGPGIAWVGSLAKPAKVGRRVAPLIGSRTGYHGETPMNPNRNSPATTLLPNMYDGNVHRTDVTSTFKTRTILRMEQALVDQPHRCLRCCVVRASPLPPYLFRNERQR
jgi:hypothetical protein